MVISCPMISGKTRDDCSCFRYILGTVIPSLPEEDRAGVLPENSEYQDDGSTSCADACRQRLLFRWLVWNYVYKCIVFIYIYTIWYILYIYISIIFTYGLVMCLNVSYIYPGWWFRPWARQVFQCISYVVFLFITDYLSHIKKTTTLVEEEQLAAHAHLVQFLLRTARRVARVAIVKSSVSLVHPIT